MIAWGCGFEDYQGFIVKLGVDGVRDLHIDDLQGSRMFQRCVQNWKDLGSKGQKAIDNKSYKSRRAWVMDNVGYTLGSKIKECWSYMLPKKMLRKGFKIPDDVAQQDEEMQDNKMEFKMKVAGVETVLTASTFLGNLTATAGTWLPNNYANYAIRLFMMSLAYGLDKHPGDKQSTTEEEVIAILHNLSALTTLDSYWVVIFAHQKDIAMVTQAMNDNPKIRGKAKDCVSHILDVIMFIFFFCENRN
jgi:hypothetical protein